MVVTVVAASTEGSDVTLPSIVANRTELECQSGDGRSPPCRQALLFGAIRRVLRSALRDAIYLAVLDTTVVAALIATFDLLECLAVVIASVEALRKCGLTSRLCVPWILVAALYGELCYGNSKRWFCHARRIVVRLTCVLRTTHDAGFF